MNFKQQSVVLVIDPDPVLFMGLQDLFQNLDLLLFRATNVMEVENILEAITVDLVFLEVEFKRDLHLSILTYLKRSHPEIKVILFTRYKNRNLFKGIFNKQKNSYLLLGKTANEKKISEVLTYPIKDKEVLITKISNFLELDEIERQIIYHLMKGKRLNNFCIQYGLPISKVLEYKKRIFSKLKVNSLPGLLRFFNKAS